MKMPEREKNAFTCFGLTEGGEGKGGKDMAGKRETALEEEKSDGGGVITPAGLLSAKTRVQT